MEIHFLGTAASEGIPNPYCSCRLCEHTRVKKGKDVRTRSSVIIDEIMQIDLSPEFSYQIMRDEVDARKIKNILFTHTHPDHFNIGELYGRMEEFGHFIDHPLKVFGNDIAISACTSLFKGYSKQRLNFHRAIPFVTLEIDGYSITPLLSNHMEWEFSYIYFIEKEGVTLFYGHDSGWFPDITWQWLEGKNIDLSVLECTLGTSGNNRTDNHMNPETIIATRDKLRAIGCYNNGSKIIISHISHNTEMNHKELQNKMAAEGILVACDGLKINI